MPTTEDITLMSHLLRRAGFGASRAEIESKADNGYESTVEELLNTDSEAAVDESMLYRYLPMTEVAFSQVQGVTHWLYYMIHTNHPLQEKLALFYHHLFATGDAKVDAPNHMLQQIQMFRDHGMGSYRDLLVELAKDPAMIFWLDNNLNHKQSPNENWGRELLELFSMGVGNYTEDDVKNCARAFTGWTISPKIPTNPYGRFYWDFEFKPEDHDYSEKTFLGHNGKFNGDDIIDIIIDHPACHRFIARHLYNFFVADEPPVPLWPTNPPRDPEAIEIIASEFSSSGYDMKSVLRTLFNSDFFKESLYLKIKSPIEMFVGTIRFTRDLEGAHPDIPLIEDVAKQPGYMGQTILDPPSVEGWHTGTGWINSGTLAKRINFVVDRVSNTKLPGMQEVIERIKSKNAYENTDKFVEECLDLIGPIQLKDASLLEIKNHVREEGSIRWDSEQELADLSRRVGETFALIASTKEYQFG